MDPRVGNQMNLRNGTRSVSPTLRFTDAQMESQHTINMLKKEMRIRYAADPVRIRVVRSPYRICPLGAHIDHQLGPVTAMAIDQAVHLAYAPSGSAEVRLSSLSFDGEVRFSLEAIPPSQDGDWGNYARGAVSALKETYPLTQGIVGVTAGRLGEGGLSSSSAIGVAYLLALEDANGLDVPVGEKSNGPAH